MKVFISWSGDRSKAVALALRDWLPEVLQMLRPWVSEEDISKGTRWSAAIAKELEDTKAGIICVTPENLDSRWLNFEAGALAKTIADTFVCPYLVGMKKAELVGPLSQMQLTLADKDDTRKLLGTLNSALATPLPEEKLNRSFEKWWPDLEAKLKEVPPAPPGAKPKRSEGQMIEEVLEIVRVLHARAERRPFDLPTQGNSRDWYPMEPTEQNFALLLQRALLRGISVEAANRAAAVFRHDGQVEGYSILLDFLLKRDPAATSET